MSRLQQLAQDAIAVQDACNPLGISNSFAEAIDELGKALRAEGQYGTDAICEHPVFRLWASKIHSLAGLGLSDVDRFHDAYSGAFALAAGCSEPGDGMSLGGTSIDFIDEQNDYAAMAAVG